MVKINTTTTTTTIINAFTIITRERCVRDMIVRSVLVASRYMTTGGGGDARESVVTGGL